MRFMRVINELNMEHIKLYVLLRRGSEWGLVVRGPPMVPLPTRDSIIAHSPLISLPPTLLAEPKTWIHNTVFCQQKEV